MIKKAVQLAAASFMLLQIGCASTTYRHAEHSTAEVEMAQLRTEETALTAMANSADLEVAQIARRMANGGDAVITANGSDTLATAERNGESASTAQR